MSLPHTPRSTPARRRLPTILLAITAAACAADAEPPADPATIPLRALADVPTVEIGAFEGDTDASFELITSVASLPDGRLVLADAGAQRIAIFDPDGRFVRDWGRRGDGPNEFRSLSRAYVSGDDRILALDARGMRVSTFDTAGTYLGGADAVTLSGDSTFTMDVWLHGRFWIDGGLSPSERDAIRTTLDHLPRPGGETPYRYVRMAADGDLWVRELWAGSAAPSRWIVIDPSGAPRFALDLPAGFTPLRATADVVDGRWLGVGDVNYLRRYDLVEVPGRVQTPTWLGEAGDNARRPGPSPEAEAEAVAEIRGSIRAMAVAQEIHYSQAMSYTSDASALDVELGEGLFFDIVEANDRGWTLVMGHGDLDRLCGLAYGATTPPGWMGGSMVCGR